MGEFALLNYLVSVVLGATAYILYRFRKRFIGMRGILFYLSFLFVTFLMLHPIFLVIIYWDLIMANQVIVPYPYTLQDRISFYIFLASISANCGIMGFMQKERVKLWWGRFRDKRKVVR